MVVRELLCSCYGVLGGWWGIVGGSWGVAMQLHWYGVLDGCLDIWGGC